MGSQVTTKKTTLPCDEVMTRAVQFFSTEKWRPTTQSGRTATFEGRIPIPWISMFITIVALMCLVIPGIICYFLLIKKLRRFQNLIVSSNPVTGGCEVAVSHPDYAMKLVARFMDGLPPLSEA